MREDFNQGASEDYIGHLSPEDREHVQQMVEKIKEWQEDFDVWGHATFSSDQAESILEHGLYTDCSGPHNIAYKLSERKDGITKQLRSWDYQALQHIVFLLLKKGLVATDIGGMHRASEAEALEHVFVRKKVPEELKRVKKGERNHIVPEKIAGYWDMTDNTFHSK